MSDGQWYTDAYISGILYAVDDFPTVRALQSRRECAYDSWRLNETGTGFINATTYTLAWLHGYQRAWAILEEAHAFVRECLEERKGTEE